MNLRDSTNFGIFLPTECGKLIKSESRTFRIATSLAKPIPLTQTRSRSRSRHQHALFDFIHLRSALLPSGMTLFRVLSADSKLERIKAAFTWRRGGAERRMEPEASARLKGERVDPRSPVLPSGKLQHSRREASAAASSAMCERDFNTSLN